MKKKIFTLFTALILSAGALFASDTSVDGIYYNFNATNLTATVTYRGSSYYEYADEYTGNVVIPATVTYGGNTYSVTSIGDDAFGGCSGLTSVTIPNSVTSIGSFAFYGCSSLTSVTIPNSVTNIGYAAFCGCSGLTSVTIPNSVTSIGEGAFYGCSGLTSVVWNAKNCADFAEYYDNVMGTYYYGPFCNIVSQITSFTFGSEVEHIPAYLCYGMENLTSVIIPNSVTSIGSYAFSGCSGLTSVTIPNSVTSIGEYAFGDCSGLTSVVWNAKNCADFSYNSAPFYNIKSQITSFTFGSEVEHIPAYLCYGMENLTSVTIPNSVTSIGEEAFGECTKLINIVCYAAEPPSCEESVFANYNVFLKVPCNNLMAYQTHVCWGSFKYISCIGSTVGLEQIELAGLYTQAGRIVCEGEFRIYDLLGRDVTRLNGSLQGIYVVKTANAAVKVVVR